MMSVSLLSTLWEKFVTAEGTCETGEIRWMKWGLEADGLVVVGCSSAESLPDDISASL